MAIGIVKAFEVIQVNQQQAELMVSAARPMKCTRQRILHSTPVEPIREGIL